MTVAAADPMRRGTAVSVLRVLAIWLVSRGLVVLGTAFGKVYIPYGQSDWDPGAAWYHRLLRWDSEWYNIIASQGYSYNGDPNVTQSVVFYPLFPLLARGLSAISGLATTDALLVVANLASLAAVLLLHRFVRGQFGERVAFLTVALLSFFPASVFLSTGYTEALVLLLMVGFFLMLQQQRFVAAALLAGLAAATRSSGVMLLPVLVFELWRRRELRLFIRDVVPLALLASAGLWLFMLYLGVTFGKPLLFSEAQAAFQGGTTLPQRMFAALTLQPLLTLNNLAEVGPGALDHWIFLIIVALLAWAWFKLDSAMVLFASLVLLLPYLTVSGGPQGLIGMARYNLVSFPLFIAGAMLLKRALWMTPAVIGVCGGLLLIYAALFSQWQWVG
jgi:Gpi18-like mannosyltransferase